MTERPEIITQAPSGAPVVAIVGWKKSGKTTLTTRLVAAFTARGYRVATVKHAHHSFAIDDGETDSARHRRAGACQVAIVSRDRWALVTELAGAPEPHLQDVIAILDPADLVVVEGYKTAPVRKIEARRQAAFGQTPLADEDPLVIAIAADHAVPDAAIPVFGLDDVEAIADFIAAAVALGPPSGGGCGDDR